MNLQQHELPKEIFTNPEDRSVLVTPEVNVFIPGLPQAFDTVDRAYADDPEQYFKNMIEFAFSFRSTEGSDVTCSLYAKDGGALDELLVVVAPFSDSEMRGKASDLYKYSVEGSGGGLRGMIRKEIAAPNTASQTIKSVTDLELLYAIEQGMPVLTLYSPMSSRVYSSDERKRIRQGDFGPASRIVSEAIDQAQIRLHGKASETQIDKINAAGSSLGATNVAAAAAGIAHAGDMEVRSVHLQELIMGPKSVCDLAGRFTVRQFVGDASTGTDEEFYVIHEPISRQMVDQDGSELIGTNARMVKGMKPTYMLGLTHPEQTSQYIAALGDYGVSTQIALAENSALTHQTLEYLPDNGEHVMTVRASRGQRIGHIMNEHVALSSILTAMSVIQGSRRA